jgi:hypothetical protein
LIWTLVKFESSQLSPLFSHIWGTIWQVVFLGDGMNRVEGTSAQGGLSIEGLRPNHLKATKSPTKDVWWLGSGSSEEYYARPMCACTSHQTCSLCDDPSCSCLAFHCSSLS